MSERLFDAIKTHGFDEYWEEAHLSLKDFSREELEQWLDWYVARIPIRLSDKDFYITNVALDSPSDITVSVTYVPRTLVP